MKLAMTSIAVTASICASASEAALLVASFMPFSLDLGVNHRRPRRRDDSIDSYSEHPTTSIRSDESPLSEYRQSQTQTVLRRDFGSQAAGLCRCHDVFGRILALKAPDSANGMAISSRSVSRGISSHALD